MESNFDEMIERIKVKKKEAGLTNKQLSEKSGVPFGTLNKILGSETKEPSINAIIKIAHALNVSTEYLINGTTDVIHLSGLANSEFDIVEPPTSLTRIPVIGEVAAGISSYADMQILDYISCDTSILNDGYDYCYLKVKGDSMEPRISEDDLVLVRVQDTVESGSYAVVLVDDDNGLVKRVEYDRKHLELISENPYYPTRKFYGEEMNRVRIFGKVVKIERYL